MTYQQAIEELEQIVKELENENVDMDKLSGKVKQASVLIRLCRKILTDTENDVHNILRELKESEHRSDAKDED